MEIHRFLEGSRYNFVAFNCKSHVEEVNGGRRRDVSDVPSQDAEVVHVLAEFGPVGCQVTRPDRKDVVNEAFEIEKIVAVFWDQTVYLVVGVVQCSPHDSCRGPHRGSNKLQKEEVSKFEDVVAHNNDHRGEDCI